LAKNRALAGKNSRLDHSWPDNIDHLKPELSICYLAIYIIRNLAGEMWSISPPFALNEFIHVNPCNPWLIDFQNL